MSAVFSINRGFHGTCGFFCHTPLICALQPRQHGIHVN
jgi:hypothetical protein